MENIKKLIPFHKITQKKKKSSETNNNKLFSLTGYNLFLYCGLIYDNTRTWVSVLHIARYYVISITGLFHPILEILLNHEAHDFLTLVELSHYVAIGTYSFVTSATLLSKSNTIKAFCNVLNEQLAIPKEKLSPKQEEIRQNTIKFIQIFKRITAYLFIWGVTNACLRRPVFDRQTKFTTIYGGWVPFEVNSWPRFIIVCTFQLIVSINSPFGMYTCLTSFVSQAKQLCCQYDHLSVYIKETFQYTQLEIAEISKEIISREKFIQSRLKYAIERHHLLIRCFNTFQDIYNQFLFLLTLCSGIIICTLIYMITDPESTPTLMLEFISLLVPEVSIIAMYCWAGQQLTDKWSEIRVAIYDVNWYNESTATKKSLLNMLTCCTKDQVITGAGLQEFSMHGFRELLQASFSYLNMLEALR